MGYKSKSQKSSTGTVVAPETTTTPVVVETTPTPEVVETTPTPEVVETTPVKKSTGRKAVVKKELQAEKQAEKQVEKQAEKQAEKKQVVKSEKKQVGKLEKKQVVKKVPVVKKEKVSESVDEEYQSDDDTKTRSFKVKLPGDDNFTGRFTGLTPYQAANKALSKYFRGLENEDNSQVNFSIRESTRGSKRHEYVYKGSRLKLEKPITYTIKSVSGEERVITKQYKNQLIKVKKGFVKQESVTV
jgi:hypothetical protein